MNEIDKINQAVNELTKKQRADGYVVTGLYLYTNQIGQILYVRFRLDHREKGKYIRPLSRDESGEWRKMKEPDFTDGKPIYNLHSISKEPDKPVFIVEGEKCADALINLGMLATTSGGTISASDADWRALANRTVVMWPDNDDAGLQYQNAVIKKLKSLNTSISVIDNSALNLSNKQDCADWIAKFKEINERLPTAKEVASLPLVEEPLAIISNDLNENEASQAQFADGDVTVNLQSASEITPRPIHWLWQGWLAKGKLHIFAGQAGTGKTTIAIAIAAIVTKGANLPDGTKSPKGNVLIWSGEDSTEDTLVPKLMAAGADLSNIYFIGDTTQNGDRRSFDPALDMQALTIQAATIPDVALLIIDPIVNVVTGDSHKNGEVRRALQPVVDFGERLNCAVLGITHFSKGGQGKDPLERVTGSLAFGALARVVLATAKIVTGDEAKRIVCRAKSNIGIDDGGFEYELQEKEVVAGINSTYVQWGDAVNGSARELLAQPDARAQVEVGKSAIDRAKEFLLEILADGEVAQKEIEDAANDADHSWRTVRRAKTDLNIQSTKSKIDQRWYWKLPNNLTKSSEDGQDAYKITAATLDNIVLLRE